MEFKQSTTILEILKITLPLALTGFIGYLFGLKQLKAKKKLDFIEQQLREFYSPLLGYRKEIITKSELRVKLENAAEEEWKYISNKLGGIEKNIAEARYAPFGKMIEYDNVQWKEVLFPLYKKMLAVFSEKLYLAHPETQKYYPKLCEFIEMWERHMTEGMPKTVLSKIDCHESDLIPFYEELKKRFNILQEKLTK